jgi:hypothetical protein
MVDAAARRPQDERVHPGVSELAQVVAVLLG